MIDHPALDLIERFAIGAIDADDDFIAHLAACDVCSERLAQEARLELALIQVKQVHAEVHRSTRVSRLTRRALPVLILAAAAALFLLLRAPFERLTEIKAEPQVAAVTTGADSPIPDVDVVIASLRPRFKRCYQAGLGDDPDMAGKVVIEAKVAPAGTVTSASATTTEGLSPSVVTCLVEVVRTAQFATTPKGSTLHIPVSFVQQGK